MKKYKTSNRKLDRYMEKLTELCGMSRRYQFITGEYITDPEYLQAIYDLESAGHIRCRYAQDHATPFFIEIMPTGRLYFYNKRERRNAFLKGFFTGLATAAVPAIITLIAQSL